MTAQATKEKALALIESQISSEVIGQLSTFAAKKVVADLNKLLQIAAEHIASGESVAPEDVKAYAATAERLGALQAFITKLAAFCDDYDSLSAFLPDEGEDSQQSGAAAIVEEQKQIIARQAKQIDRLTALLNNETGTSKTE